MPNESVVNSDVSLNEENRISIVTDDPKPLNLLSVLDPEYVKVRRSSETQILEILSPNGTRR